MIFLPIETTVNYIILSHDIKQVGYSNLFVEVHVPLLLVSEQMIGYTGCYRLTCSISSGYMVETALRFLPKPIETLGLGY